MRKLIVAEHLSLDGVMQGPGGPEEDPSGDFHLGGWTAAFSDEAIGQAVGVQLAQPFDLLLGRRTYDIWAAYWPHVQKGNAIADKFNSVTKYVATHRPNELEWEVSRALNGDLVQLVNALKREDGADLLTWGSGEVVRQMLSAGLVDELQLIIYPVVLGHGKRLFDDRALASSFTLAESTTSAKGVMITRYVRSGDVQTGKVG